MKLKIIHSILAFLFILFAAMQWNDPDGLFWIGIYVYPAVLFVLSLLRIHHKIPIYIGIAGYLIAVIMLMPDVLSWLKMGAPSITGSMQAGSMYIEKVREFFGLFICLSAMIYLFFSAGKRK